MEPTLFVVMQQPIKSQLLCQLSYAPGNDYGDCERSG